MKTQRMEIVEEIPGVLGFGQPKGWYIIYLDEEGKCVGVINQNWGDKKTAQLALKMEKKAALKMEKKNQ